MSDNTKDALVDGRFAADESDDNSIDVSNPEYIGVDPEYRNHAEYDEGPSNAPLPSEDDVVKAREDRAKEHGQVVDGPHGYTTKTAEAGGLTPASPYSAGAQADASPAEDTSGGEQEATGDATADPDASNQSGGSWPPAQV